MYSFTLALSDTSLVQELLATQGYKPRKSEITIRLADAHRFDVNIRVNHQAVSTTLIANAELPNSKTLLEVDFLKRANMALDLTKDEWYFSDEQNNRHRFLSESSNSGEIINNETLILGDEEGKHLDDNQKTRTNLLLADMFSPNDKHDETPIAVPPYIMTPE
ncbi:hypothetical protein CBL_20060 [Carabus blaptoides fortunei]